MISRIIFNENITVAFCSSAQLSSAQLSSNINLFKIFALLFNAFNKLCHCEPNKVKAWQSTFNKALNSVKSNLLFVDCFGLRPRNDGERDCLAFSMPRNDGERDCLAFSMPRNDGERDCLAFSMPRNDREKKTVIPSVAKESRIKKVNFKNLVLLINEFYKKWIASDFVLAMTGKEIALAFSMPRNYDYVFSYASKFEIISHNKNLKSIYYGFLFNKQNFIVRGGIGQ